MIERLPDGRICPVCNEKEAVYFATVDVWSNTDIAACAECAEILSEGTRYQYHNNAPKAWLIKHKEKINAAFGELHREYERSAKKK